MIGLIGVWVCAIAVVIADYGMLINLFNEDFYLYSMLWWVVGIVSVIPLTIVLMGDDR